jgi:chromosome segregation ATPase
VTQSIPIPGAITDLSHRVGRVEERVDRLEEGQGVILREASAAHEHAAGARVAAERAADAVGSFAAEYRRNEAASSARCREVHRAVDARIAAVEGERPSTLDWELDEPTGVHPAPVWATRARDAADELARVQAELAAAQARLEERERQSDRAREAAEAAERRGDVLAERRWTKAQKVGAGVLALLAAGGGGAGILELIRQWIGG